MPGQSLLYSQLGNGNFEPYAGKMAVDVKGARDAAATPLQLYMGKGGIFSAHNPPTTEDLAHAANQIWTFVRVGDAYLIASKLDSNLVIDVVDGTAAAGTLLQIFTRKPTGTAAEIEQAKNQLWRLVSVRYPTPPNTLSDAVPGYMIASELDPDLVIDVKGAHETDGAVLQIFHKKPTATVADLRRAENQLWALVTAEWVPPENPPKIVIG